jgi:ectoine hydroxylase-related dioxygenase (phytanoyl-CoA dioxygenase family)
MSRGEKIETQPGDVLIFHALAPHQSGPNTAAYSRRSLYLSYNAASAGNLREAYYRAQTARLAQDGEGGYFK